MSYKAGTSVTRVNADGSSEHSTRFPATPTQPDHAQARALALIYDDDLEGMGNLSRAYLALDAWKREAMSVLAEWEKVWEAVGRPGPLGGSKASNTLRALAASAGEGRTLVELLSVLALIADEVGADSETVKWEELPRIVKERLAAPVSRQVMAEIRRHANLAGFVHINNVESALAASAGEGREAQQIADALFGAGTWMAQHTNTPDAIVAFVSETMAQSAAPVSRECPGGLCDGSGIVGWDEGDQARTAHCPKCHVSREGEAVAWLSSVEGRPPITTAEKRRMTEVMPTTARAWDVPLYAAPVREVTAEMVEAAYKTLQVTHHAQMAQRERVRLALTTALATRDGQ